jgi:hypothetical protein
VRTLRLRCTCGRNLADVTYSSLNPDWTRDKLVVTPRPGVKQQDYRPWEAANRGGWIGTPGRAAATPGRVENVDFDWHDRTYTWHCRCKAPSGKPTTHTRRHERISAKWVEHSPSDQSVVCLTVGLDL